MARPREYYVAQLISFLASENNKFTYLGGYNKAREKCSFQCNACNTTFLSSPNNILRGKGCPECAGRNWTTPKLQQYLESNQKNITILSEYCGSKSPMTVVCDICSYGWVSNPDNIKNNGCPSCNKKIKGSLDSLQEFLNNIDSKVVVSGNYKNKGTHVDCKCSLCEFEWRAVPAALKRGTACPSCSTTGFNPGKPAYLYYLRVEADMGVFWKIGITGKDINHRFHAEDRKKITILYSYKFLDGTHARRAEQSILKLFDVYRVKERLGILERGGNTELFYKDVLQMDHMRTYHDS